MTPRGALVVLATALTLTAAVLLDRRRDVRDEIGALTAAATALGDSLESARLATEIDRVRLSLERARARPEGVVEPHLAFAVGHHILTLERGGVVLRSAEVSGEVRRGEGAVRRSTERSVELADGTVLRPLRAAVDSAGSGPGTLWLSPRDFEAIRAVIRPGTPAYLY